MRLLVNPQSWISDRGLSGAIGICFGTATAILTPDKSYQVTQATFLPYSAPFLKDVIHLQPPVLLSGCLLPRKAHLSGTSKPLPPALPTHPPSSAAVTAAYKSTPARGPTAGYLQVNASKRTSVISSPRVTAPSPPFVRWMGVLLTSQPSWSFCD